MASRETLHAVLADGVRSLNLDLPDALLARQLDYLELLIRWNRRFNLTAVREPRDMVVRHLLDSLAVLPHVAGPTLADLGSGAGLPGLPLALARPDLHVTLVDSNGKKARFLRAVQREMGLDNVAVAQMRVEAMQGNFDCLTTRAFASVADMLRWGGHLLAPGARLLALKGRLSEPEVDGIEPPFRLRNALPLSIPGLDAARHVLIIDRDFSEDHP